MLSLEQSMDNDKKTMRSLFLADYSAMAYFYGNVDAVTPSNKSSDFLVNFAEKI